MNNLMRRIIYYGATSSLYWVGLDLNGPMIGEVIGIDHIAQGFFEVRCIASTHLSLIQTNEIWTVYSYADIADGIKINRSDLILFSHWYTTPRFFEILKNNTEKKTIWNRFLSTTVILQIIKICRRNLSAHKP
jgi:hypothetical protein